MTDAPKAIPEDLGTAHAPVRAAPWGDGKTPKAHNIFCDEHENTIAQGMTPEMAEYVAGLINAHGMGDMIMRTHSDALVAAAYEDAAVIALSCVHLTPDPDSVIRQRVPANAQAAYDAAIAQARREGWEAAKDEAVVRCHEEITAARENGGEAQAMGAMWCKQSIQALEYKEPSND